MCQGKALASIDGSGRQTEQSRSGQTQELARLASEAATNDQVDTATGTHFVKQHIALERKLGHGLTVFDHFAIVGQHFDDITHFEAVDIDFNGQRTRVFLRIEENGGNLSAQSDAAKSFVGDERNVLTRGPDHAVRGRFA